MDLSKSEVDLVLSFVHDGILWKEDEVEDYPEDVFAGLGLSLSGKKFSRELLKPKLEPVEPVEQAQGQQAEDPIAHMGREDLSREVPAVKRGANLSSTPQN